jgi:hypothetical protein
MNGRMNAVKPAAATNTELVSAPANAIATVTLSVCNQSSSSDTVRVAVCSGGLGTLVDADYIEFDTNVSANAVLERTGIVIFNGQTIVVRSSGGNCSFVAYGLEG